MESQFTTRILRNRKLWVCLLLLSILTLGVNSACSKGCLSCDTANDKCLVCDPFQKFQLNSENGCTEITVADCDVVDPSAGDPKCLQCKSNMLFDFAEAKCVDVPSNKKVQNCSKYNQAGECVVCDEKHYIENGNCSQAAIEVDGCLVFTEANFCSVCEKGKLFDDETGKCVAFSAGSNCQTHAFATCDECLAGYNLELNSIFAAAQTPNINIIVFYNTDASFDGNFQSKAISNCVKIPFDNCVTYEKVNGKIVGCATCGAGRYLNTTTKMCDLNPSIIIKDCQVYTNSSTCYRCVENFYLNGNECTAITAINDCQIYMRDENKCQTCIEAKYLATNGDACSDRATFPIANCETHSSIADECTNCLAEHVRTTDKLACLPKIMNCSIYEDSTKDTTALDCKNCDNKYYLDSTKKMCLVQNQPNCQTHVTNENNCQTCLTGFYKSDAEPFTCTKKLIDGCETFSTDQINECTNCKNLYSKSVDNKTCTALADVNCAMNTVNTTTCTHCKRGFYLDGTPACVASNKTVDPLCTMVTTDGTCTHCENGYLPFKLLTYPTNLPANCAKADEATGNCLQCAEDMDGADDSGNIVCTSAADKTGKCKQLKEGIKVALADNDGDCALCRNVADHFLHANTCTDRDLYLKHKCSVFDLTSKNCLTCNANNELIKLPNKTAYCLEPPTVYTIDTIDNCLVYDFYNNKKCLECENNHNLTAGDPDTCTPTGVDPVDDWDQHYIDFSINMEIKKGLYGGGTVIANCQKHYYSYSKMAIRCSECKTGFTAIVEYMDPSDSTKHFTADPNNMMIMSTKNNIIECKTMTDADFMRYETGTALAIATDCAVAIQLSNYTDNYLCISCGAGKVGIPKKFLFDKDGTDATSTGLPLDRLGYGSCSSTSELSKAYKYFYYANVEKDYILTFEEIMYDTCSDNTKNVVHIRKNISFKLSIDVEGPAGSERVNTLCEVIPAAGKLDFCQVYTLEPSTSATRDLALEDSYKCLACKPGYLMTSETQGEQCLPIENCNLTGTNTWMNACETCDSGYSWPINSSNNMPNFGKCRVNKDTTETSCMLNQSSNGECQLCRNNKTLNMTTKKCENFPSYCSGNGFPDHDLLTDISQNSEKDAFQTIFLAMFLDNFKLAPSKCSSCNNSTKMFMSSNIDDSNKYICASNQIKVGDIEGCLVMTNNGTFCNECSSEYMRNSVNGSCVLRGNSKFDRTCRELGGTNKCGYCFEGYFGTSTFECTETSHCLETDTAVSSSNKCTHCEWGYKRDLTDLTKCVEIDNDDSECLSWRYSGSNSHCAKCRDCTQTPLRKFKSNTEENVRCVNSQSSYDLSKFILEYEKDSSVYREAYYGSDFYGVPTGKYITSNFPDSSAYPQYICVRGPVDNNCTAWGNANKYDCTGCAPGYYLHSSSGRCKMGTLKGCSIYTSHQDCSICMNEPSADSHWKSYYKNLINLCVEHTVNNCDGFKPTDNECQNCKNGYHLNNNKCEPNVKATNCAKSVQNQDLCETCSEKFYKDSQLCKPYTVTNCSSKNSNSDACTACNDDYFLSLSNCVANTAPNCATKSKSSNSCLSCSNANEYSNGSEGCMAQPEITGCKVYLTSSLGCDECNDGFFISDKTCYANPTGIENCVVYSTATTCTTCANTHFLNGEVCAEVTNTVSGCVIYSADGVCTQCNANQLLSATGDSCTAVNEASCATWTDIDNCATCAGNNILKANADSKMQCVSSEIDHCLTPVAGTPNTCTSCADGFLLKEGICSAPKISITNCRVYDVTTENCTECYAGNVLSADKTKCLSKIAKAGDFCARAHIKSDEEPTCTLCSFGYSQNDEGNCEQCGGEGCFICDTSDLTKCKVCQKSYYMSSSGTCSLNNPPEPESVTVLRMAGLIALLALFLKLE